MTTAPQNKLTLSQTQTPAGEGWLGICNGTIHWLSLGSLDVADVQAYWEGPICFSTDCPISPQRLEQAAKGNDSLPLEPLGTEFQKKVWKELQGIEVGQTVDYRTLAQKVASTNHARAVGSAVGSNPIAWLIPCHRVLPAKGGVGQYHWGTDKKEKLLLWENGRCEPSSSTTESPSSTCFEEVARSTAEIAHDLNNFLVPIRMATQLLKQKSTDPSLDRYIGMIQEATESARNIIQDIIQFAFDCKSEDKQSLEVQSALEDIITSVQPNIPSRIDLRSGCAPQLPPLQIAPTKFKRIISNLIMNANDAISGQGRISVDASLYDATEPVHGINRTLPPGTYLRISVTDTGKGIPDNLKERIFEPFFTTKSRQSNRGIGLASTYGIVAKSGGMIRLESKLGQGSKFQMFFPVEATQDSC